ncbi:ArsR family transcriptional regulator [Limnohabitans sp. B9-3]|nr:ArsR family transcriptional regulator [Limnohabitans sp. B9-3]
MSTTQTPEIQQVEALSALLQITPSALSFHLKALAMPM